MQRVEADGTAGARGARERSATGAPGAAELTLRRAHPADAEALSRLDAAAASDSGERSAAIARWCQSGDAILAIRDGEPVGYCVVEYTFFGQGFVAMLSVALSARRRGVGERLLRAAIESCATDKLFTSTNVSNQPMQRLLRRMDWRAVGFVDGLDEGDPELFYLWPH